MSLHSCCAPDSSQLSPDLSCLSTSQLQPFQDSQDDMSSGPSCSDYAGTSSGIACAIPRRLGKSSVTRVIKSLDSWSCNIPFSGSLLDRAIWQAQRDTICGSRSYFNMQLGKWQILISEAYVLQAQNDCRSTCLSTLCLSTESRPEWSLSPWRRSSGRALGFVLR